MARLAEEKLQYSTKKSVLCLAFHWRTFDMASQGPTRCSKSGISSPIHQHFSHQIGGLISAFGMGHGVFAGSNTLGPVFDVR